MRGGHDGDPRLDALREALLEVLRPGAGLLLAEAAGSGTGVGVGVGVGRVRPRALVPVPRPGGDHPGPGASDDSDLAASSEASGQERERLIALVELARGGDAEAFGLLFDHYHRAVHRFLHHRTGSATLAEDLTSETFFRALRSMQDFRWQGRDFGAWLMTIARNLAMDHFKSGRTRLETSTDDMSPHEGALGRARTGTADLGGTEETVLARLTSEVLLTTLRTLPDDQRDCLVMRFLQGMTTAETAEALGRSSGAVKQLQLRGLRNLAARLPAEVTQP